MNNKQVFISHSSNDRQTAVALCKYLEAHNIHCWIAPRNIDVGKDYAQSIMEAIESSAIMILILSNAANNSKHVRNEIERAFNHQLVIMPFRIQNIVPGGSFEYFLSATHWLDAFDDKPEKYFPLLYENCKRVVQVDASTTPAQTNAAVEKHTSARTKKYGIISIVSLLVLAACIFLIYFFNNKNSLIVKQNKTNADSAIVKVDSNTLIKNKDSTKINHTSSLLLNNAMRQDTIKNNKTVTGNAGKVNEEASAQLPEAVNGVYQNAVTNDNLTLSSSGDFSGVIQNKDVSGQLKFISGKTYRISGHQLSGNISFSSDYNSFSGSISFSDLGITAKLDMIKK